MKKLLYLLLFIAGIASAQSPVNGSYGRFRDYVSSYTANSTLFLYGRGSGLVDVQDSLKLSGLTASTLAYLNGSKVFTSLANGSGFLKNNGSGTLSYSTVALGSEVSGTLPYTNGGTGLSALGTALQQLRVNAGATALEYFTPAAALTFGTDNQIPYVNAGGTDFDYGNLTFDGTIGNVTGNWDVSGYVEAGNLRIATNTFSSQNADGNIIYSPNGTGINQFTKSIQPSTNGTLSLGASSTRFDDLYLAGEIFMINSGGISVTPAVQGGARTYTIPDFGGSDSFVGLAATQTLTNKSISGATNTITNVPISTGVSGLGTGVATALGVNVGTSGAFQRNNDGFNGTVGATTPNTGSFTTVSTTGTVTVTSNDPIYRLIESDASQEWRIRSSGGTFNITNQTSGTNPFQLSTAGAATFSGTIGLTGTRVSNIYTTNQTTTNAETVDSDSTLKEDVTQLPSQLSKIAQIKPVTHEWKDKVKRDSATHFSVIAQEIRAIYPEVVVSTLDSLGNETLGVRYQELIPPMIKAIQELSAQITELQQKVATLEAKK